jgi:glucose/arabinose dehydrogenase
MLAHFNRARRCLARCKRTGTLPARLQKFRRGFLGLRGKSGPRWGPPAALAVMNDGSLLIDTGGTIWRVSYMGQKTEPLIGKT